jgi:signal transduction histidine kinase/ActR/RegA family two-component response regulator
MPQIALKRITTLVTIFGVYVLAGRLGLSVTFVHSSASPVWAPTGIALAAFLIFGSAVWPVIFAGAFLVNIWIPGATVLPSLGIAAGNTLEGIVGAWLVTRFAGGRRAFTNPRLLFCFALLAGLLATALSPTIGVTSLALADEGVWTSYWSIWHTWWLGDAAGALIVTPLLLSWAEKPRGRWSRMRWLEAVLLLVSLLAMAQFVFGGVFPGDGTREPLQFLCLPPLLWAAVRFGPRETATAGALLSVIAIHGTLRGEGPFVVASPNDSLLLLQAFMAVTILTALLVAANIQSRHDAEAVSRAARLDAEEANRTKDEFLAVLSHELRTPLNAIYGWAHLLRDGSLDEETSRTAVETILRNAVVQTKLISDILDVSRIVSGKISLETKPVELGPIVTSVADGLRPEADARGVRVVIGIEPGSTCVEGDPERLQQVVWNLLSNGIKFAPPGKGRLEVQVALADEQVVVTVKDNGPGIRPDFLPHVFERFRREDSSTTRQHAGLGLGLAIVRHLVDLHGGSISAGNRSDATGAVFTLSLPRASAGTIATSEPDPPSEISRERSFEGKRVLVVDDEADALQLARTLLSRWGASVVRASSVTEALAAIERDPPDLVLTDIGMPGEDGFTLLRRMAELPHEKARRVPVGAITAYASSQDREKAFRAGFRAYLTKPLHPQELAQAVETLAAERLSPS